MKKQLILSLVVVFALAVFAPAVAMAIDTDSNIVMVDGEEKKAETKKTTECTAKKAEAKTSSCCSAKKAECATTKKECTEKKAEKK